MVLIGEGEKNWRKSLAIQLGIEGRQPFDYNPGE